MTCSTARMQPPTTTSAVRYCTTRSIGHGEFNQLFGRRIMRRPTRRASTTARLSPRSASSTSASSTSMLRSIVLLAASVGGVACSLMPGGIFPCHQRIRGSRPGNHRESGGVERGVGQDAHAEATGAQRADAQHQPDKEQTRVLHG